MECVLCGAVIEPHRNDDGVIFWEGGHNAEPLAEGSCCDNCQPKVLKERMKRAGFCERHIDLIIKSKEVAKRSRDE